MTDDPNARKVKAIIEKLRAKFIANVPPSEHFLYGLSLHI